MWHHAQAFLPHFTGTVLDALIGSARDKSQFNAQLALLVITGVTAAVFTGLRGGLLTIAIARVKARLRRRCFAAVLQQDMAWFNDHRVGDITSRLVAYVCGCPAVVV